MIKQLKTFDANILVIEIIEGSTQIGEKFGIELVQNKIDWALTFVNQG